MKFIYIPVIAAMTIAASGCSVINKITGKQSETQSSVTVNGAQAEKVTSNGSTRQELAEQIAETKGNDEERRLRPINPTPVLVYSDDSTEMPETVAAKSTELSPLERVLGGSWTIISVGNTKIDRDDDMPYIVFVPGDGSFYANNGCNTLNGTFTTEGESITFHNILTTMRYCADVHFDHEINAIISDGTPWNVKITEDGSQTILDLTTTTGSVQLRMRRGNLEFLNGQWEITAVAGLETLAAPATVFFDLNDMKLHGNTGCNFINGEIYLDHRVPNGVDFSNIITTLRACQFPSQQTAILVGLEETASAVSDGDDKVVLLDGDGKIMMELKKVVINQ